MSFGACPADTKLSAEAEPVHSFRTLLQDLATLARNRIQPKDGSVEPFDILTTPTPLQQRAFDLLRVAPRLQSRRDPIGRPMPP